MSPPNETVALTQYIRFNNKTFAQTKRRGRFPRRPAKPTFAQQLHQERDGEKMVSTFFGLETARRGMQVHQRALDITGHNLANASTPGYSRQEVLITTTYPYTNPTMYSANTPGQLGTGAAVDIIRRVKDEYMDNNLRKAITDTAYWEEQISFLQRAEASFAEPASAGIAQRITDFFATWMDLNNTPQDPGIKAAVVELGDELASMLSFTYDQMDDIEESIYNNNASGDITGKLQDQVDLLNTTLTEISQLTKAIKKVYSVGQQPNDLLDKRDQLLEKLSAFGPVDVTFDTQDGKPTGDISLKLFGQTIDMTDLKKFTLSADADEKIILNYDSAHVINLTDNCANTTLGGGLLGLENARQELMQYKEMLNDIAEIFQNKITSVIEGMPGENFFTGTLETGDFQVNSVLKDEPEKLDGTMAQDIANLRDDDISEMFAPTHPLYAKHSSKEYTIEEYFATLVTQVGANAKSTDSVAGNQNAIRQQIESLRDSVSGVSVDEELTKMIQYQYGFQASARMINTLDQMLDVVINRLF
ncbi:flagellar hook-associated protein FlgK [Peptococcaceae bacterium 1198_IL3148]